MEAISSSRWCGQTFQIQRTGKRRSGECGTKGIIGDGESTKDGGVEVVGDERQWNGNGENGLKKGLGEGVC